MRDRTVGFVLGIVTITASVIVVQGLLRSWALTHPDNQTLQGYLKLMG